MANAIPPADTKLYPQERHNRILELVATRGRVEVTTLADELDVTTETIRRDLTKLVRQGLVRRVHGGAIHVERLGYEPTMSVAASGSPPKRSASPARRAT